MADDAIREDVSQEEATDLEQEITTEDTDESSDLTTEEEAEEPISDRDQSLKEIWAKKKKLNQREHEGVEEPDENPEPEEAEAEEVDTENATPDETEADSNDEMVELKVNGQIIYRSKQEVEDAGGVAAIQKSIAGDIKLAQAAEERKRFETRERELNQRLAQTAARNAELEAALNGNKDLSDSEIEAKSKQLAEKFFMGDQEELQSAIADLLKSGKKVDKPIQPIDEEALAEKTAKKIEFQNNRKKAQNWFNENHSDLSTNSHRRSLVNNMTIEVMNEMRQRGEEIDPMKVVEEAVTLTRERYGIPEPTAAAPETHLDKKRNRKKQSVDSVPTASQRVPAPAKQKAKSKRQIFEDLNKGRSHA